MADFLLTPEADPCGALEKEKVQEKEKERGEKFVTDENDGPRSVNCEANSLVDTPLVAKSKSIPSPNEVHLGDTSSVSSTPSKRLLEDSITDENELCSAEKRRKEQEESERLAWQLMEEESMNAYQMQVDYMRANPQLFSEDDLAAVGAVLQEARQEPQQEREDNGEEWSDEEEGIEEDNSQEWTYEQLLELGNTIGDVKTERWKMRSANVIATLPKMSYEDFRETKEAQDKVDSDCPVCMERFESNHDVIVLPCQHFFHSECSEGWLKENNSCPLCKKKITLSP